MLERHTYLEIILNIFNTLIFKKVSSINTLLQFTNIILVCWFISCVNLTGRRDAQTTGKTLFLNVSVRVIREETDICISRPSKGERPLSMQVDITQPIEGLNRTRE